MLHKLCDWPCKPGICVCPSRCDLGALLPSLPVSFGLRVRDREKAVPDPVAVHHLMASLVCWWGVYRFAMLSLRGLERWQVAEADARRHGGVPMLHGPGGGSLTLGQAVSALEKRMALLKRRIQQKSAGFAAVQRPSADGIVVPPPLGGDLVSPHSSAVQRDTAVSGQRQWSPALEIDRATRPLDSEARCRSPATTTANPQVAALGRASRSGHAPSLPLLETVCALA
jgi:hypothetical protein